jgi:sterol desaturase/sphingolipid hydroxylase (fatty acid hydroxylase superfamily)
VILKSIDGIPNPQFPRGVVVADEARKARRRFNPATIILTTYSVTLLGIAFYRHPGTAAVFLLLGIAIWTALEYWVHRFVLHGPFPDGSAFIKHRLHKFFDTMHGDHHQRPWDGMYINGYLDALPFAGLFIVFSFLAPYYTVPVLVAALLQSYVIEEWVHYSVHFHRFRSRYFQYIRFHHWYHHSPRGSEQAFGLTSGLWDDILGTTAIPSSIQRGRRAAVTPLSSEPFESPESEREALEPQPEPELAAK